MCWIFYAAGLNTGMEDIMKQMLKIELERAFKSAGLKVSLLIGIVISVISFFQKGITNRHSNPLHFYKQVILKQ